MSNFFQEKVFLHIGLVGSIRKQLARLSQESRRHIGGKTCERQRGEKAGVSSERCRTMIEA